MGIRLYRRGYTTKSLSRATLENAPETKTVWIKQRTRWLKGWLQTWLVFMRNPIRLAQSLGTLEFIVLQIVVGGMLVAAIAHPLMYLFIIHTTKKIQASGLDSLDSFHNILFLLDIFNLVGGYIIFAFSGLRAFIGPEKRDFKYRRLVMLPVYWILMSIAAMRALIQLPKRAHIWEKTPHKSILAPRDRS